MRKKWLLKFLAAGFLLAPAALGCSDEVVCADNHVITSAEQLEEESICNQIEGDLFITGTDLKDLKAFKRIREVGGCLRIEGNDALVTLDGLDGLMSVGKCLMISHNDQLATVDSLNYLRQIPTDLTISYNESLAGLDGLNNITSVGKLQIEYNPSLVDLSGLARLEEVKQGLIISHNDSLTSLVELGQQTDRGGVKSIGTRLTITYNDELAQCRAESFRDDRRLGLDVDVTIKGNTGETPCQ